MNIVFIAVIVLVLFVYFGGKNVPDVLKKNKEMLLGFVVGLVASSFMGGNLVEGNDNGDGDGGKGCVDSIPKLCKVLDIPFSGWSCDGDFSPGKLHNGACDKTCGYC